VGIDFVLMPHPLHTYIAAMPDARARAALASRCGTSLQYLRHISAGRKRPSVELCAAIELATGGDVRCEELRPDVDWVYLAGRRASVAE